jgi:DNA-binding NarL/FixJ family response regulator
MTNSIAVSVLAPEPLREAGMMAMLETLPELLVQTFSAAVPGDVVVACLSRLVTETLQQVRTAAQVHGSAAILVTDGRESNVEAIVSAGAVTVLHVVEASRSHLLSAIHHAIAMKKSELEVTRADLLGQVHRIEKLNARNEASPVLSQRETDVLRYLAAGFDTNEILKTMRISERTLKYILWCIMNRFSLRNRVHAVAFAIRAGLI